MKLNQPLTTCQACVLEKTDHNTQTLDFKKTRNRWEMQPSILEHWMSQSETFWGDIRNLFENQESAKRIKK